MPCCSRDLDIDPMPLICKLEQHILKGFEKLADEEDRQTNRYTDRLTDTQSDKQIHRQTNKYTDRQIHRQINRHTDRRD